MIRDLTNNMRGRMNDCRHHRCDRLSRLESNDGNLTPHMPEFEGHHHHRHSHRPHRRRFYEPEYEDNDIENFGKVVSHKIIRSDPEQDALDGTGIPVIRRRIIRGGGFDEEAKVPVIRRIIKHKTGPPDGPI